MAKNKMIGIRVTEEELKVLKEFVESKGVEMSSFIIEAINDKAGAKLIKRVYTGEMKIKLLRI